MSINNEIFEVIKAAQVVWDYHLLNQELSPCDLIVCFCSNDLRVAEHCADLWKKGLAEKILFSGGFGRGTEGVFKLSEAELFAKRAEEFGVPKEAIIIENKSTNTGENISFSKKIIEENNLVVKNIILAQKPYMERRVFATISKQWQEVNAKISSPKIAMIDYCTEEISCEELINFMVGDLQRIIEYPKLGFQISQDVPAEVVEAMNYLLESGFQKYALKN